MVEWEDDGNIEHKFIITCRSIPSVDGVHTGDIEGFLNDARDLTIKVYHKIKGRWVRVEDEDVGADKNEM